MADTKDKVSIALLRCFWCSALTLSNKCCSSVTEFKWKYIWWLQPLLPLLAYHVRFACHVNYVLITLGVWLLNRTQTVCTRTTLYYWWRIQCVMSRSNLRLFRPHTAGSHRMCFIASSRAVTSVFMKLGKPGGPKPACVVGLPQWAGYVDTFLLCDQLFLWKPLGLNKTRDKS